MREPGSDVFTRHLLVMVAILSSSVTWACQVNISNWEEAQETFKDNTEVYGAKVLNLWISGVKWSNYSNEVKEVFDPNWWGWATEDTTTLLEMPIDSKILSVGLLSIAIRDVSLRMVSDPSGCFEELDFRKQRQLVSEEILRLTAVRGNGDGDDLICRSVFSQRSLWTGNVAGVGKTCCKRKEIQRDPNGDCSGKREAKDSDAYAKKSAAVAVIGTLLPFMIIPCALAWWQLHPVSAGKDFAKYLMNKLTKYAHFRVRSRGHDQIDEAELIIKEDELEPYGGAVSLTELLDINMRVSGAKIKLTILFLLQYIPVIGWLVSYRCMAGTLAKLDSTEKILLNLRNNPISWLWTDRSFFPFYIGLVLVVFNFMAIIMVLVWWLMENQTVRLAFAKCLRKLTRRTRWGKKEETCLYRIVQKTFTVFFINLLICSYVSIYSLFHSIMYTIGGLIVSIDIVSPWLTGSLLVIYYFQRSYRGMIDSYTEIKRLVFELCKANKVYKATHECSFDVTDENLVRETIEERRQDKRGKTIYYKSKRFQGPVLFVYHSKPEETQGIVEIKISKAMLRQICERIKPVKSSIRDALVELFFTIVFLFLVVFTMTVFRLHTVTGEVSTLITSMATLLTALIPRLTSMMGTDAEGRLSDDILKYNIEKLLKVHRPTFKLIDSTKTPDHQSNVNPLIDTHVVPEHQPHDSNDFCGPLSDLPTLTGGEFPQEMIEILQQYLGRRRHDSGKASNHSTPMLPTLHEATGNDRHFGASRRPADSTDGILYRGCPHGMSEGSLQDVDLNCTEMTTINDSRHDGTNHIQFASVETYI